MAGEQRCRLAEPAVGGPLAQQVGEQQIQDTFDPALGHVARRGQDPDRVRPETLPFEPQGLEPRFMLQEGSHLPGRHVEHMRDQQELARGLLLLEATEGAVEEHSLVGGMLVDENHGAGRLRHQVTAQKLPDVLEWRQLRPFSLPPLERGGPVGPGERRFSARRAFEA